MNMESISVSAAICSMFEVSVKLISQHERHYVSGFAAVCVVNHDFGSVCR